MSDKTRNLEWRQRSKEYGSVDSVAVAENVLPIPVTHPYVAKTIGADAEACTLANGEPGQILVVTAVVAGGGAATITPVTATGWATVILLGAKDQVTLFYANDTAGWIILGAKGTDAPPVTT